MSADASDFGHPGELRVAAASAPLRQQVVERLREAIAQGRFRPGERLIERELCELLGVSRTSLREALRELETDGIVTSVPNRGVVVTVIDAEGADEIYDLRQMLESRIAARFAERASDDEIALLERRVETLAAAYRSGQGLLQAKSAFYDALMAGSGHRLATLMLRSIQLRAGQLRLLTLSDPDRSERSLVEIRELLGAIKRRDVAAAAEAAAEHVRNAGEFALRLLKQARELSPRQAGHRR